MRCNSRIHADCGYLSKLLNDAHLFPILNDGEDFILSKEWLSKQDEKSLSKLIRGHMKLVVKIANGYSGYGMPLNDLVAEGTIGIMHAANNYNPDLGYRFSTYATWWIKAKIQEYVYNFFSMVKLGSKDAYKKLFFKLRTVKRKLGINSDLSREDVKRIVDEVEDVTEQDVLDINTLFSNRDFSINSYLSDAEQSHTWEELVIDSNVDIENDLLERHEAEHKKSLIQQALQVLSKRERDVIVWHRLTDPHLTLEAIGEKLELSKERIRQIEKQAFLKIKNFIVRSVKQ